MQAILDSTEGYTTMDNINGTLYFDQTTREVHYEYHKGDGYQQIFNAYIKNPFFLWTLLVLLLNAKNWKKPVVSVLVVHWFLRSTGDLIRNIMTVRDVAPNTVWPFDKTNWILANSIAHVVWLSGEIVGDWYPLLRTKAVTNDEKSMRKVYVTCILYNLVKVAGMVCFFLHLDKLDFRYVQNRDDGSVDFVEYTMNWWIVIMFIQITSCLYDISVILTLKSNLFNKLKKRKNSNKNSFFFEKFKEISELRIFISMLASIIFVPFVVTFIIYMEYYYKQYDKDTPLKSDSEIEHLREVVLNFNYALMYIDQILLRIIAKKSKNGSSNNSSSRESSSTNSNHLINVNYKKNNLYENPITNDTTKLLRPSYQGIFTTANNNENMYRNMGKYMENNKNDYEFNNYNNQHRSFANSNYRSSIYNAETSPYRNLNININSRYNGGSSGPTTPTDNYYNKNSMYYMDRVNNNR